MQLFTWLQIASLHQYNMRLARNRPSKRFNLHRVDATRKMRFSVCESKLIYTTGALKIDDRGMSPLEAHNADDSCSLVSREQKRAEDTNYAGFDLPTVLACS